MMKRLEPKFKDSDVRWVLRRFEPGKTIVLMQPSYMGEEQVTRRPDGFSKSYTDEDLKKHGGAPSLALVDLVVKDVTDVLNVSPIRWYFWGAVFRMNKTDSSMSIELEPAR